jgi:tetratricopeptide (TPR) repeat protein
MLNSDFILRIVEQFGRELAIIMGLRKRNKYEEALIYIDNLLLQMTGLTSSFINGMSEEMLIKTFSPLGQLNAHACLWTASLLKAEGEVYEDLGNANESYYRFHKALFLLLEVILHELADSDSELFQVVDDLLQKLADYELPVPTREKLFAYYEHIGKYATAEDLLFELLEMSPPATRMFDLGRDFYARLQKKSEDDLIAGNFSHEEVEEGLAHLQGLQRH